MPHTSNMPNVPVKGFFLRKFSEMSLEDLNTKDNFSYRISLQDG